MLEITLKVTNEPISQMLGIPITIKNNQHANITDAYNDNKLNQ